WRAYHALTRRGYGAGKACCNRGLRLVRRQRQECRCSVRKKVAVRRKTATGARLFLRWTGQSLTKCCYGGKDLLKPWAAGGDAPTTGMSLFRAAESSCGP